VDIDRDPVFTNSLILEAFDHLASNWRLNQDVGLKFEIVDLQGDYFLCLPFGSAVISFEKFFGLIDLHLPDDMKLAFTKAALTVCWNRFAKRYPWVLEEILSYTCCYRGWWWWWPKAYMSSSWEQLLRCVSTDEIFSSYKDMTRGAAILVRESTLVMVAERLLKDLKVSIRYGYSTSSGLDYNFFQRGASCHNYMNILRTLRDEKLAVDPHFSEFLLDILEWQVSRM
jgi:hypothetical protein